MPWWQPELGFLALLQIIRGIFLGHECEAIWLSLNPSFPFRIEA